MEYKAFQSVEWLPQATIYEVNVRQYTNEGTFAAFQKHLPRLKDMGITVLWFMPIHPIGIQNRKESLGSYYSIQDYKAINAEFGDLQDFKNIIAEAHTLGMKVIIDWVANHTSWDHVWFHKHNEYFAKDANGNCFAPYDWSDVVQLNHTNTAQQDAMVDAMAYWVQEVDIDGFRCDMAHLTPLDFWKKARRHCDAIRPLLWLAETQDLPYFEVFDIIYGWEWLHKMQDYYNGNTNMEGLWNVIAQYWTDVDKNKFRILFTSNHDENSWQDTEYKRLGAAAKVFGVLCATLPGVPLLYNGQEEPLLKALNFFNKDYIGFENYALATFYKTLFLWRQTNVALAASKQTTFRRLYTTANDKMLVFGRTNATNAILVICNLSNDNALAFTIQDDALQGIFKNINGNDEKDFSTNKTFFINAWDYACYEQI
jgi:alpha-amylase